MNRKAALELSANVIVILIVGIVILGLGLALFFNFIRQADDFRDSLTQQEERQIEALLAQGHSVTVPFPNQHAGNGETATFAYGIKNRWTGLAPNQDFTVQVEEDAFADEAGQEQPYDQWQDWITQYSEGPFTIEKNGNVMRLVLITVPDEASRGTYVFNLLICIDANADKGTEGCNSGYYRYGIAKLYVENP